MIKRAARRARSSQLTAVEHLVQDAAALAVALSEADAARLLRLTEELARWNRRYNLTAIRPEEMSTHHLLDSLAVQGELAGRRIADAGTGAGFPGLPLALINPEREFTLIDATAKKLRFVAHAAELLGLANVTALHGRVEALPGRPTFDTVVTRAFAPLPKLLESVAPLCTRATRVLAMKGRWPQDELAALPPGWRVTASRRLGVPGLAAERCVIALARTAASTAGAAAAPSSP
jgi:16S rRNA (guanine527-N7)-methyltransferase